MTIAIANTSNSSTFQYWLDRTNELADAMSTKVVTVNSAITTGNATVNGVFTSTTLSANTLRGGNNTSSATLSISSNVTINVSSYFVVGDTSTCTTISSSSLLIGNSTVNTIANSSYLKVTNISVGNTTVNTIANSSYIRVSTISVGNSTQNLATNSTSIAVNGIITAIPLTINVQTSGTGTQVLDYFSLTEHRSAEYVISITDNNANGYQISKLNVIHNGGDSLIADYGLLFTNSQLATFTTTVNATSCVVSVKPTSTNTQIKGTKLLVVV